MKTALELAQAALSYIEDQKIASPMTPYIEYFRQRSRFKSFYQNRGPASDFSALLADHLKQLPKRNKKGVFIPLHDPETIHHLETMIGEKTSAQLKELVTLYGYYQKSFFSQEVRLTTSTFSCFFNCCTKSQSPSNTARIERAYAMADDAKEKKTGTCEMLASLAFQFLSSYDEASDTRLELVFLQEVDHVVLLIGRDPATDITNPPSWNKDSAVCDPYAHNYYYANEFIEQMKFLANMNTFDEPETFQCAGHVCNQKDQLQQSKKLR